jgi:hypothetical protein
LAAAPEALLELSFVRSDFRLERLQLRAVAQKRVKLLPLPLLNRFQLACLLVAQDVDARLLQPSHIVT